MKVWCFFVYLIGATALFAQQDVPIPVIPDGRIVHEIVDPERVTQLRLRPGYVTSVRVPDDVTSVVMGNPASFKAEHSDAEPHLVFIKPLTSAPVETNVLITTKSGRGISLNLLSSGTRDANGPIDFVLEYARPRSFLIEDTRPNFTVADTRSLSNQSLPMPVARADLGGKLNELLQSKPGNAQHWRGKQLRVALDRVTNDKQDTIALFSVLNTSGKTIELMPPQVQLASISKSKKTKSISAVQVPVAAYKMSQRHLPPQARAFVAVAFERPSFKQSTERMLLQVAQAEEVDHPVLVPIPFVTAVEGGQE